MNEYRRCYFANSSTFLYMDHKRVSTFTYENAFELLCASESWCGQLYEVSLFDKTFTSAKSKASFWSNNIRKKEPHNHVLFFHVTINLSLRIPKCHMLYLLNTGASLFKTHKRIPHNLMNILKLVCSLLCEP